MYYYFSPTTGSCVPFFDGTVFLNIACIGSGVSQAMAIKLYPNTTTCSKAATNLLATNALSLSSLSGGGVYNSINASAPGTCSTGNNNVFQGILGGDAAYQMTTCINPFPTGR